MKPSLRLIERRYLHIFLASAPDGVSGQLHALTAFEAIQMEYEVSDCIPLAEARQGLMTAVICVLVP
jgi:hypothetical protein